MIASQGCVLYSERKLRCGPIRSGNEGALSSTRLIPGFANSNLSIRLEARAAKEHIRACPK